MKAIIGLVSFALAIGIAPARAIDLTCRGEMHYYESKHIEVTIPPGAAIVDLEKRSITTPLGDFRITVVSEGSISFSDPAEKWLIVSGTLDRMSGLMRVFWQNPKDNTKMARYGELKCSTAKRLF